MVVGTAFSLLYASPAHSELATASHFLVDVLAVLSVGLSILTYGVYGYPAPSCRGYGPWTRDRRLVPIGDRVRPGGSSHALSRPSFSTPTARQPLLALESEYTRLWPTRRNANWSRWGISWPIQVEESARPGGQDRQRMGRRHPAYLRRICATVPNKSHSDGSQIGRGMGRHAGPAEVVTLTYDRIISRPSGVTKLPIARVWRGLGDFLFRVHRRYGMSVYLHPRWCPS